MEHSEKRGSAAIEDTTGGKLLEIIASKLEGGETVECWFTGMDEPSGPLLWIPLIGTLLEFQKRFFVVAMTQRRLLLIEIKKPFFKCNELQTIACPLQDVRSFDVTLGKLSATVRVGIADGQSFKLSSVDADVAALVKEKSRELVPQSEEGP